MIQELVDYWTRSTTPIQSWSQMAVYTLFCGLSSVCGWWLRGVRDDAKKRRDEWDSKR